jgi:hypothetical protein
VPVKVKNKLQNAYSQTLNKNPPCVTIMDDVTIIDNENYLKIKKARQGINTREINKKCVVLSIASYWPSLTA